MSRFPVLFINAATVGIMVTVWWKMRGLVMNVEKDRSESRWIDRLIYHEAGHFSDLQQQVAAQTQQLSTIANARSSAYQSLQDEATDSKAGSYRVQQVLDEVSEVEAWSFEDELLGEVRREVVAAHTRQAVAFQAAASFSSSSADCAPAAELEQTLSQLLALETAGHGNDYAARTAGGKVVYSHALTSPSYPSASSESSLGGTMLHILGLQAPFPPPESVLGPATTSSSDFAASSPVAAVVTASSSESPDSDNEDSSSSRGGFNGYRAQCWAFAGSAGRFTVKLATPVAVTHLSMEQRPPSQSTRLEESATPRDFTAWGLTSPSDPEPVKLGSFTFDQQGTPRQTFSTSIAASTSKSSTPVGYVTFDIRSNHGNSNFTCLHQIRVHSAEI